MRPTMLSLLMLLALPAAADYKSDYSDGVKAIERGNWARAKEKLQSAIADSPTPQARVRLYGMRLEPYIPHFYLGVALSNLKDCSGALQALNNTASQKILAEVEDLSAQRTQAQQIISRCSAAAPPLAPSQPAVVPATPVTPALTPAELQKLSTLRTSVDSLQARVQRRRAALAATDAEGLRRIDSALALARSTLERMAADKQGAQLASTEAALLQQQTALTALEKRADAAIASAAQQPATQSTPALAVTPVAPVEKVLAPALLTQITEHYFAGRLSAAARMDVSSLRGKPLALALQLRAAARYSIYSQQGSQNADQLAEVSADLREAKRADSSVRPSSRFFPAKLIALYINS
jgi:hypothetical protein